MIYKLKRKVKIISSRKSMHIKIKKNLIFMNSKYMKSYHLNVNSVILSSFQHLALNYVITASIKNSLLIYDTKIKYFMNK